MILLTLNFAIVATSLQVFEGQRVLTPRSSASSLPPQALNVVLAVAGAAIYVEVGLAGIAFALTAVFAFAYQARLLEQSRQRAQQYVSLSWGVLAGLMRSLNTRDGRAARHAAAVARFARDMAQSVGMDAQEQELAHTAGLLHDIGHFALSDRVAERGKVLQEEDWIAIQRHPELGAEMLKDLGMYGPVAEIVLAHHERIDGRGYPQGLTEEQIPEIAKMIAVAEVYDTLTASDTYRTRMSSFEALRELRRVAGTQLDCRYVEVLAGPADRRGHRVPPRGRRGLRRRAGDGAADQGSARRRRAAPRRVPAAPEEISRCWPCAAASSPDPAATSETARSARSRSGAGPRASGRTRGIPCRTTAGWSLAKRPARGRPATSRGRADLKRLDSWTAFQTHLRRVGEPRPAIAQPWPPKPPVPLSDWGASAWSRRFAG